MEVDDLISGTISNQNEHWALMCFDVILDKGLDPTVHFLLHCWNINIIINLYHNDYGKLYFPLTHPPQSQSQPLDESKLIRQTQLYQHPRSNFSPWATFVFYWWGNLIRNLQLNDQITTAQSWFGECWRCEGSGRRPNVF